MQNGTSCRLFEGIFSSQHWAKTAPLLAWGNTDHAGLTMKHLHKADILI